MSGVQIRCSCGHQDVWTAFEVPRLSQAVRKKIAYQSAKGVSADDIDVLPKWRCHKCGAFYVSGSKAA